MSRKNKKLGRGLQDLLNQREEKEQKEELYEREDGETYGGKIDVTEGTVSPNQFADELAEDGAKYRASIFAKDEDETGSEDDDSETYSFGSMREDLDQVTNDVRALSEEVESFKAETEQKDGALGESKTLLDYMTSGDDSKPAEEKTKRRTVKPEVLVVEDEESITSRVTEAENTDDVNRIYNISVSLVDSNPWQPREVFQSKEINELAESIDTHGLLQPIVVRESRGRYQLIAGERRFRAALKLGWTQVPSTIIDATDREMAELALVENLQRKDLNPIEKATSFENYLQANHCKQEVLAKRLNIDRSTIANLQRLLTLPSEVQQMVVDEKLTQGHARALLTLKKSQDQIEMANRIADEKLSVRQTEQVIADWNEKSVQERKTGKISTVAAPTKGSRKKEKSPNVLELERQLQDVLDMKVKITADANGKGKLEIFFRNNDDFSSLMEFFKG
ncbi:MAG: ParB/RepB/Spo0J family partition protein [Thermoguttaceae bacterium]|nr:ParB/RepB/Spo0J family partition protein [Thermoguttaceae bacterium]